MEWKMIDINEDKKCARTGHIRVFVLMSAATFMCGRVVQFQGTIEIGLDKLITITTQGGIASDIGDFQ